MGILSAKKSMRKTNVLAGSGERSAKSDTQALGLKEVLRMKHSHRMSQMDGSYLPKKSAHTLEDVQAKTGLRMTNEAQSSWTRDGKCYNIITHDKFDRAGLSKIDAKATRGFRRALNGSRRFQDSILRSREHAIRAKEKWPENRMAITKTTKHKHDTSYDVITGRDIPSWISPRANTRGMSKKAWPIWARINDSNEFATPREPLRHGPDPARKHEWHVAMKDTSGFRLKAGQSLLKPPQRSTEGAAAASVSETQRWKKF